MGEQVQNVSPREVHRFLHSRPEGLKPHEVAERRREVGPNTLEIRRKFQWAKSLARQFTNFFSILLSVSAAICFIADTIQPGEGMAVLGWALFGVSVLNALFSFVQEYRAERAMEELQKFLPQKISVRRDGRDMEIAADELVPGDILQVREGDKIPADARLTEIHDLTVNNAPLTGESNPVHLTAQAGREPLAAAANILFAGCVVLRGSGEAVVFATGFRTEFGKIATLSQEVRRKASPLEHETARMVRILTVIAVAMGLTFFVYGVVTGRSLWVNLVFMMGIIVANVPEGLLPTFTLSLAMGSLRMARRNVLVKGLNAVEALGAVHVICTDKTGTLTLNRLTVSSLAGPASAEAPARAADRIALLRLALAASEVRAADDHWAGDPLDVAIAEAYEAEGRKPGPVLKATRRRITFDPERRRATGILAHGKAHTLATKGAWESLRPLLAHVVGETGGKPLKATEGRLEAADAVVGELAGAGYRVIAVASRPLDRLPAEDAELAKFERGLTLAGFVCLEDPIRPEVPDAVVRCREAGIRVVMITGDHPNTAESVARRIGVVAADAEPGASVLTGDVLAHMRRRNLVAALRKGVTVFARTTPEQKWKIVTALQGMDKVVAVTGDGVNDAPALKAADVGIAMGKSGTDVAREAARVVLLDDNFASIVAGVEEGRTIFANIGKFTNYVLVSNGPEILPYLLYMLFPVPLALTVIQILSIDLGTDIVPSMGLGQEKPDPDVMRQPPREREQGLLTWPLIAHSYLFLGLIEAAFALGLFFWVLDHGGWMWGQELAAGDPLYHSATGITLSAIILMQIGNLFGRRSRYRSGLTRDAFANPLILAGLAFEIVFSWAILYFPPLSAILGTGPVAPGVYAFAWFGVPLIFGLDYARKRIAWRLASGRWRHDAPPPA